MYNIQYLNECLNYVVTGVDFSSPESFKKTFEAMVQAYPFELRRGLWFLIDELTAELKPFN